MVLDSENNLYTSESENDNLSYLSCADNFESNYEMQNDEEAISKPKNKKRSNKRANRKANRKANRRARKMKREKKQTPGSKWCCKEGKSTLKKQAITSRKQNRALQGSGKRGKHAHAKSLKQQIAAANVTQVCENAPKQVLDLALYKFNIDE